MNRECGDCTKCCEGNLTFKIKDINVYKGKPCPFVDIHKGCSIYEDRPEKPCKAYKCAWLSEPTIPLWMKPNKINAIIDIRTVNGIKFLNLIEAGETLRSDVLTHCFLYAKANKLNFAWQVKGGQNWYGSPEFCKIMEQDHGTKV